MHRVRVCFCIPSMTAGGVDRIAMTTAASLGPGRADVALLVQEREGRLLDSIPNGLKVRFINEGPYRRSQLPTSLPATIREARRRDVMVSVTIVQWEALFRS